MKQISSFIAEISDEFKIVVVDAIRVLCLKFPKKQAALMAILATALREEGGAEYKRAIVKTIISLVENIPDAKETGLAHLCEFIEVIQTRFSFIYFLAPRLEMHIKYQPESKSYNIHPAV